MLSYQEETTMAPTHKSAMRQHEANSPICSSGFKVDMRTSRQQDFTKTMVDTFTPCSWNTGKSSLDVRAQNQPVPIDLKNTKLAEIELGQEQARRILKAKRAITGSKEEACQQTLSSDPN